MEEHADARADDAADRSADQGEDQNRVAEVTADVADREETQRHDAHFEGGSQNGANRARDNAGNDVTHTHKHSLFFVEHHGVASDVLPNLDRDAFVAAAAALAATLRPGDVVALSGELGAGKTTFVRALVGTLHGTDAAVSSPTFVFRQRYPGEPPVEHLDVYRIEDPVESLDLGLEDAFTSETITLVEWPERVPGLIPAGAIRVAIAGSGDGPRSLRIERAR
jgi:tRNA threonylcarbamoyl adenosine modification protein YjeE